MPKINIKLQSEMDVDEAFQRVSEMFEQDSELKKLDPNYSCDFDPADHCGTATGKQFKAHMKVLKSNDGSEVSVDVDLPFHLGLVKGVVEKTLQKKLQEALS